MKSKENHKNKWMELPRIVDVGHGVIHDTGKVCKDLKLNGIGLIVAGSSTLQAAGKAAASSLEDGGYDVETVVAKTPTLEEVIKVEIKACEEKVSFLLGVGGGKSIDIA